MIRALFCALALLVAAAAQPAEPAPGGGLSAEQLAELAVKVAEQLSGDGRLLSPEEFSEMMERGAAIYSRDGAGGVSAASFMLVIYVFSAIVGILLIAWIRSNKRAQTQAFERFEQAETRHGILLRELQASHEKQEEHDREILRASTAAISELAAATTKSLGDALKASDTKDGS